MRAPAFKRIGNLRASLTFSRTRGLDEDPGWRYQASDPLVALRYLWIAFCLAVVVVCAIAARVHRDDPPGANVLAHKLAVGGAIFTVGAISLAAQFLIRRTLDCTSLRTLAISYRSRFIFRMRISELVMLIAFLISRVWDLGGSSTWAR